MDARARYSASDEERERVDCFLAHQLIKEEPRKTQEPMIDFSVSEHSAQSESLKALRERDYSVGKNIPLAGQLFMYRRT